MGWVAGRREFEDVEIGEQERVEERCVRVMQAVVVVEVAQSTQTLPLLGRDRQRPFVEEEGPWDPRWLAAGELGRRPHPRPRQLQPRRKKNSPENWEAGPRGGSPRYHVLPGYPRGGQSVVEGGQRFTGFLLTGAPVQRACAVRSWVSGDMYMSGSVRGRCVVVGRRDLGNMTLLPSLAP
jgi:hypothetical protein